MAISEMERKTFERVIAEVGRDPEKARATIKVLYNFLKKTSTISIEIQSDVQRTLEQIPYHDSNKALQDELQKLGEILVILAQEDAGRTYSTGQLAKYFGVSITTINNWIASGRFIGVERDKRNKQARILENTIWVSPIGEKVSVHDIVDSYVKSQEIRNKGQENKVGNFSTPDFHNPALSHIRHIVDTINFFENRYGKTFEEVVEEKGDPDSSDDWIWAREGKEWSSLLREIGDIC